MNATKGNNLPAEMRASDSDRDAVVSDLSEHFQAGRLTAAEFDQRMEQVLAARTWGELKALLADLPATRPAPAAPAATSSDTRPRPSSVGFAPPAVACLAAIAITAVVLVNLTHGGWGFIWLPFAVLFIARRLSRHPRASGRCGPRS